MRLRGHHRHIGTFQHTPTSYLLVGKSQLSSARIHARLKANNSGTAKSSRYQHAARHLAECDALASQIEDFGMFERHVTYVARLKRDHGRKSGFWGHFA